MVYVAEQEQPARRRIALKAITERGTGHPIACFVSEAGFQIKKTMLWVTLIMGLGDVTAYSEYFRVYSVQYYAPPHPVCGWLQGIGYDYKLYIAL